MKTDTITHLKKTMVNGLATATIAVIALCILALTALAGWSFAKSSEPTTPPTQTISTETKKLGDVKRYCIVVKTKDHIDAIDCNLVDPMTGKIL